MLEALIASIGYSGGIIADKIILSRHRIPVMRFIPLLFIWLAVITGLFLAKWGSVNTDTLYSPANLVLFVLMILAAVAWNILYYRGVQKENLAEFELIMLLTPLATIIFAGIFLPAERNASAFAAGLIASLALVASRFRRHHVRLSRVAKQSMLAMIFMSLESIFIKELLEVFSPVALYFVRTTVLAVVFLLLYRPKLLAFSPTAFALTIISAVFGVVQMVLKFYGFQNVGIVETTMILLLGPFFVYIFSYFYFHERLYKRDVAALAAIVVSILYVEFWK
ncbi:MAG: DMT family transporter [Patescibacteria group bacterium]|jgi:drug/metabolite transporter (DMT)-like permease